MKWYDRVTIVIVAYKYNATLKELLYDITKNFEGQVIVVNNNNKNDEFYDKNCRIFEQFSSIKVYDTNVATNANIARNIGAKNCNTTFIKYVDEDDRIYMENLQEMVELADNSNYSVVYGKTKINRKGFLNKLFFSNKKEIDLVEGLQKDILKGYFIGYSGIAVANTGNSLIRMSSLVKCGLWDEKLSKSQDRELFARMALKNEEFYFLDTLILEYNLEWTLLKLKLLYRYTPIFFSYFDEYIQCLSIEERNKIYNENILFFSWSKNYKKRLGQSLLLDK